MPVESITAFNGGLVTRPAPHLLAANEAVVVENCHIRDGSIRPMLAATLSTASGTACQSIYRFNGAWETNTGERWYAEDNGILYWTDGGIPQKKRASDGGQVRLGIETPAGIVAASATVAHGDIIDQLDIAITFYSDPLLGGWGGESAPLLASPGNGGTLSAITVALDAVAGITENDTEIKLSGDPIAAGFMDDGGYIITSGAFGTREIIRYSGVKYDGASYYFIGCSRAQLGSVARAWGPSTDLYAYGTTGFSLSSIPISADSQVSARRIYKLSAGEYKLVAQIDDNTTTTLADTAMQDSDLAGASILTSDEYDPPEDLDGICGPYNGMLFGWKDKTVYWSEVGLPDAWPALNQFTYRTTIAACVVFGGSVVVLCEDAPYTISGTDPDSLYRSKALSQQGCLYGRTAVNAGQSLLYLSPDGICAFNGVSSVVISGALAKSDFSLTSPHAAYHDEQYFLFHTGGCIIGDFRDGRPIWRTCTETGISAYRDPSADTLYIGRANGVYEWDAGDSLEWRYWTGELAAGSLAQSKDFWFMICHAEGELTCKLMVDGNERHRKEDLYQPTRKPYRMRLSGSARGYRPQIRLNGTGVLYALEIEHSGPGRSR